MPVLAPGGKLRCQTSLKATLCILDLIQPGKHPPGPPKHEGDCAAPPRDTDSQGSSKSKVVLWFWHHPDENPVCS
jgi:hypothetical protein